MRPRRLRILRRPARLNIGVLLSQAPAATWPFRSCCAIETLCSVDMGQGTSCRARRTRSRRHDNAAICRSYVAPGRYHVSVISGFPLHLMHFPSSTEHLQEDIAQLRSILKNDYHFPRLALFSVARSGRSCAGRLQSVPPRCCPCRWGQDRG